MNRKYLYLVGLAFLLFFGFNVNVQAAVPKVLLNGSDISLGDVGLVFENNRILVPIRPLANALNCNINFDGINQTVTLEKDSNIIKFIIGQKTAYKNGKEILLDIPLRIIGSSAFVPLRFISENFDASVSWDAVNKIVNIKTNQDNNYATVQSEEDLKNILKDFTNQQNNPQILKGMGEATIKNSAANDSVAPTAASPTRFSETNVQVKGIDESDIVKTDGKYIYQIRGDIVTVSEVYPANEMKVLKNIDFDDNNFVPNELYVDENHLVVLGTTYKSNLNSEKITYENMPSSDNKGDITTLDSKTSIMPGRIMPPYQSKIALSKIISYNIADKNNISFERAVEIEGNYISSRKVGNYIYFISNKYMDFCGGDVRPLYMDSAIQSELKTIDYSDIHYFPNHISPNLISVIALDLDGSGKQAKLETYLGSSDNIYMSDKNLYIAQSPDYNETTIFKFNIDNDNIKYVNKGVVKGHILNQFSMDEFDDSFRIATTSWNNSSNNLFVLDQQMKTIGKLTGLAPNEKIYSVRFMGEKAYLVTFEQTDPLFVIDLSNKLEPKVLGELVIPGFSNYLHPLDANHILGIGKDTSVVEDNNFKRVKQGGIKIAIFDVSDVTKPVQESMKIIGDSGSYSEALYNHKAILFDKDNNLLALPVNLVEYKGETYNIVNETQCVFVLDVSLNKGITTKGQIFHSDSNYSQNSKIQRSLYINDILYTVSNSKIKANLISNLQEVGSLQF
jgi:uncharacterized secreted protein with C-terminal beta-propeller domain